MLPGTYKKREFTFGRQDIAPIGGIKSVFYVMPSSSARCAAFPTSDTKLPWFREIKALKGIVRRNSRLTLYPLVFGTVTKRKFWKKNQQKACDVTVRIKEIKIICADRVSVGLYNWHIFLFSVASFPSYWHMPF